MKAIKCNIDNNGRIAIPAIMRRKLHLKKGDSVSLNCTDSTITISTTRSNLEKAWEVMNKYEKLDLQKELKLLKKEDASKY